MCIVGYWFHKSLRNLKKMCLYGAQKIQRKSWIVLLKGNVNCVGKIFKSGITFQFHNPILWESYLNSSIQPLNVVEARADGTLFPDGTPPKNRSLFLPRFKIGEGICASFSPLARVEAFSNPSLTSWISSNKRSSASPKFLKNKNNICKIWKT